MTWTIAYIRIEYPGAYCPECKRPFGRCPEKESERVLRPEDRENGHRAAER